jgi:hypothetical protein
LIGIVTDQKVSGGDFGEFSNFIVQWGQNDTSVKVVEVLVRCDALPEGTETFSMELVPTGGYDNYAATSAERETHYIQVQINDESCPTNEHEACFETKERFQQLGCGSYIVPAGGACENIATQFNVSVDNVSFAFGGQQCTDGHDGNGLWEKDVMTVRGSPFCDNLYCRRHVVRAGETCSSISDQYDVPAQHLYRNIGTQSATPCDTIEHPNNCNPMRCGLQVFDVLDVVVADCIVDNRPPAPRDLQLEPSSTESDKLILSWEHGFGLPPTQFGWRIEYSTDPLLLPTQGDGKPYAQRGRASDAGMADVFFGSFDIAGATVKSTAVPKPPDTRAETLYAAVSQLVGASGADSAVRPGPFSTAERSLGGQRPSAADCALPSSSFGSNRDGLPAEMQCRSWGDPHFQMFQGYKHSFQGFGEYVLAQGSGRQFDSDSELFQVQTCHKEVVPGFPATVTSAIGISGGRHGRFTMEATGQIRLEGILVGTWNRDSSPFAGSGSYVLGQPTTGGRVVTESEAASNLFFNGEVSSNDNFTTSAGVIRIVSDRDGVKLSFPDGEQLKISYNGWGLDATISLPTSNYFGRVSGLCGSFGDTREEAFHARYSWHCSLNGIAADCFFLISGATYQNSHTRPLLIQLLQEQQRCQAQNAFCKSIVTEDEYMNGGLVGEHGTRFWD